MHLSGNLKEPKSTQLFHLHRHQNEINILCVILKKMDFSIDCIMETVNLLPQKL